MKRSLVVLLVAGACASGVRVYAHHSFAAEYLGDHEISIEGEVVRFMYRNPHSFLDVMAPEPGKKTMAHWVIEWNAGGMLGKHGVRHETLKPGDRVVITGSPGRIAADHRLRLRTIARPKDGWRWEGE